MPLSRTMDGNATPLTFAPDGEGVLHHVDEVGNGLACGCLCPSCGARLVAKQGAKTVHHFAHEGGTDCVSGVETALHLAAKELLARERRMSLPALMEQADAKDSSGCSHSAKRSIASKTVSFDAVSVEVWLDGARPDIVATVGGKTLLIEIAVSHFADELKVSLIRERGLAAVEVDLSGMAEGWTWASLSEAVVGKASGKKWLFNPKSENLRMEALQEALAIATKADSENAAREARIRESHELQRASIPGFRAAKERLAEFLSPDNLAAERARMDAEGPLTGEWLSASRMLGIRWDNPPTHINVEVSGETGFPVDRRVWQAALFALFVRGNRNKTFSIKSVARWCVRIFGWRPEFAVLHKHDRLLTPEEQKVLPSASRAVSAYLRALEGFGFIAQKGDRYEILRRHS